MPTVVIPWRPQPSRIPAFETVAAWYREHLPDARLTTIDTDDEPFNLARCRNQGVAALDADDDIAILADADTLPEIGPLRAAIAAAATSGLVQLPYTEYHWLGAPGTAQYRAGTPIDACDFELVRGACSGVYVTTRATWLRHGGQDEGFRGWGYEDAAWYLAHETLLGAPPQRHEGRVYQLHHVAETRAGAHFDANAARMERYREAAGNPVAMRALVAGD